MRSLPKTQLTAAPLTYATALQHPRLFIRVYSDEIYKNNSIPRAKDKNGTFLFLIKFIGSGWSGRVHFLARNLNRMRDERRKKGFKYTSVRCEFPRDFYEAFFAAIFMSFRPHFRMYQSIAERLLLSLLFQWIFRCMLAQRRPRELNLPAINFNGFGLLVR